MTETMAEDASFHVWMLVDPPAVFHPTQVLEMCREAWELGDNVTDEQVFEQAVESGAFVLQEIM